MELYKETKPLKSQRVRRLLRCAFKMGRESTEDNFYDWLDKVTEKRM